MQGRGGQGRGGHGRRGHGRLLWGQIEGHGREGMVRGHARGCMLGGNYRVVIHLSHHYLYFFITLSCNKRLVHPVNY